MSRIAWVQRHDNGRRMPVDLEQCPCRGYACTPSYFSDAIAGKRFGSRWIVEKLLQGVVLELRCMQNGDWFVIELNGTEGEVINGDQLGDLWRCATTTTTHGPTTTTADRLLNAAAQAGLKGAELKVVQKIAQSGKLTIPDANNACECDAGSAFKRAKKKLRRHSWDLYQHDGFLMAKQLSPRGRK